MPASSLIVPLLAGTRLLHACCMSCMRCHTSFAPNLPCSASCALPRNQAFLAFLTALRASLLALANSSLTRGDPLLSHFAYRLFLCWKRGSRVSALSLHQSGCLRCSLPKTSVVASISPALMVVHFFSTVLPTFQAALVEASSRSWKRCLGLFVLSSVVLHLSAETLNFLGGLL